MFGYPPFFMKIFVTRYNVQLLGLGTHLFVKIPRPGDSEGTFSILESKVPCSRTYKRTCRRISTQTL